MSFKNSEISFKHNEMSFKNNEMRPITHDKSPAQKLHLDVLRQVPRVHSNNPKINVRMVHAPALKNRNNSIEAVVLQKDKSQTHNKDHPKVDMMSNEADEEL